ncbi:MAG TPA: glycine/sarcosine/betaine reductase selenoprotein B family protein [Burkholderiales bacterium]
MARIEDIPEPTRGVVLGLEMMAFDSTPFVTGGPLAKRRVAMVSSAALVRRGEAPFLPGTAEVRTLAASLPAADLLMSHVSINFDRAAWQSDINTVYPIDRLRALAACGVIGSVADTHYSVMGSTDPRTMADTAAGIAAQMQAEGVDAALLLPV